MVQIYEYPELNTKTYDQVVALGASGAKYDGTEQRDGEPQIFNFFAKDIYPDISPINASMIISGFKATDNIIIIPERYNLNDPYEQIDSLDGPGITFPRDNTYLTNNIDRKKFIQLNIDQIVNLHNLDKSGINLISDIDRCTPLLTATGKDANGFLVVTQEDKNSHEWRTTVPLSNGNKLRVNVLISGPGQQRNAMAAMTNLIASLQPWTKMADIYSGVGNKVDVINDPLVAIATQRNPILDSTLALGHELIHAYHYLYGCAYENKHKQDIQFNRHNGKESFEEITTTGGDDFIRLIRGTATCPST
ncbi:hypothetical protein H7U08_31290 [Bacillus cereus]|uniref:Botulinum/Tetanus toxin catalytic chain domain-containing protein n=1 Tax=Bacillus cereus TaxID=1396 RepID=A0AAW4R2Q5_BACCE|nr:tetanus/botulinum neurotoxin [Bacillus cereus]MBY0040957.1 hypothetical protein [Bacillus cereus]